MKHDTQITLDVEVTYEDLDSITVQGSRLPAMVDVTGAFLLYRLKNGKVKRINITKALTEEQLMLIEDEILELQTTG